MLKNTPVAVFLSTVMDSDGSQVTSLGLQSFAQFASPLMNSKIWAPPKASPVMFPECFLSLYYLLLGQHGKLETFFTFFKF